MNNFKLRALVTGNENDDFVEVNGYIGIAEAADVYVDVVPFGDKFAYGLRTSADDIFGPVSNQVPGICNGTFTHTTSANGQVSSTTLTGEGSGATFSYSFLADGTLSFIRAATSGSGYKVGDKLQITTNQGHVIEFRLVDGSNAFKVRVRMAHDRQQPLPFPVHRFQVRGTTDRSFFVLDERSQQVFPRPQDKLLDKYPDAAAAYGLRLLRSAYLGPAIRVRRESTGWPEIDIHFDGQGNLDTKALLDFAGTSSVRVKTWYDQSGGGNDATQSTNASQPTIVNGGVLVTVNGKPALDFDGSDDKLDTNASDLYGQARLDAYFHIESDDNLHIMFSASTSGGNHAFGVQKNSTNTTLAAAYSNADSKVYVNGVDMNIVNGTTTRDDLHTAIIKNGADHSTGAIVVHEDVFTTNWTDFKFSAYTSFLFDGKMTEVVLYNTDQSANREDIEKDMALHSGAFQVEDAPLLDAYGGAHAAYSLRKLNSDYTGAAIRIRRQGDHTEADIGFDSNGNLDEAAVIAHGNGTACYVKTWYDQSGNGNDSTQSTNTFQPIILYSQQSLPKIDGRVALRFDGNDNALPFDNTGLDVGNLSSFAVMKYITTDNQQMGLGLSGATGDKRWYAPYLNGGNFNYGYKNDSTKINTTADTSNNLHTMIAGATQGDVEAFLNGTSAGTTPLVTGISNAAGIGNLGGSFHMNGFIQEVVVYSSDQSERREGIERNISNHYDL